MINSKNEKKALNAIQDLVIVARTFVYSDFPKEKMISFLDDLEYLPALMLEEKDHTQYFEKYLEDICKEYNCIQVLNRYNSR